MRIKFLSIIASFFIVAFTTTSCLGDDDEIEYSADATIHTFELDTIYGVNYKFTIDQIKGEIYNVDSLPVHADTIIDKILITNLTTASGVVTMKNKSDQDSIIFISGTQVVDSMDLRKPIKLKVYAPNYLQTKTYTIEVRVHKHDPDSLRWGYMGKIDNNITGEQKAVILEDQILTYTVVNGSLQVFRNKMGSSSSAWAYSAVTDEKFGNTLPSSILSYNNKLYATSSTKDGIVYESTDGVNWQASSLFGDNHVVLLLAPLSDKITFIKEVDENGTKNKYFDSTDKVTVNSGEGKGKLQLVPADFPIGNISYTAYSTATAKEGIMLIGKTETPSIVGDDTETIVPWGYMGDKWTAFPPNNTISNCPAIENPSIIYYNEQFYIFGDKFESFYVSPSGLTWKKANAKFSFPNYNWDASGVILKPTIDDPEFRGRKNYSMAYDSQNQYIYILFGKESGVQVTSERTYNHESEVWRGRLSQLWFDLSRKQ